MYLFVAHLWITPETARWETHLAAVIMDYVLHYGACVCIMYSHADVCVWPYPINVYRNVETAFFYDTVIFGRFASFRRFIQTRE